MPIDYLEEYRKCIRNKYENEKKGIHTNYLFNPSPAKLRDLCILLFREKQNKDDLESFKLYFGFEFSLDKTFELNQDERLNKFKTIGKFLKGESSLTNTNGLDLAAMFVGLEKRPFNKFSRIPIEEKELLEISPSFPENIKKGEEKEKTEIPILGITNPPDSKSTDIIIPTAPSWFKKNSILIFIGIIVLFTIIIIKNRFLSSEKAKMVWLKDHFEKIDNRIINEDKNLSFPLDEEAIQKFKKIIPCDSTKFERNGKTCLWYGKSLNGNEYEFFTAHGIHPETGKTLKEVTPHIMNKYGKGPCK